MPAKQPISIAGKRFRLAPGVTYQGGEGKHHWFVRHRKNLANEAIQVDERFFERAYSGEHILGFGNNCDARICTRV